MSTITKKWLQQTIAELEQERDATPGAVNEDAGKALEAMRIALASLEAEGDSEPVAFINGAWTLVYYRPPKELGLKIGDKLFAAPPAPVVPDEKTMPIASKMFAIDAVAAIAEVKGWNACRTAMLKGTEPVTTAYKLPPHAFRELVNSLLDTAVKYQGCQQLREQLSRTLQTFIEPAAPQQEMK